MIFLPEIRLKKICDALVDYLRKDLKEHIDKNKENESYLYLLFHQDSKDENISVNYEEAKTIFQRKEEDVRYLKISPVFDRRRAQMPTVHIVVPQDNEDFRQIGDLEGGIYIDHSTIADKVQRGFMTHFNLITTSDNITEVLLINYILRALLLGAIPQLEVLGFINPQFSVQDLNINPELIPANAYMKGIIISAIYTEIVPQIGREARLNTIIFNINEIIY